MTDPSSTDLPTDSDSHETEGLEAFILSNPPTKPSPSKPKGKGARLSDDELVAQIVQRVGLAEKISEFVSTSESFNSEENLALKSQQENSLPVFEGYSQLFNPESNPFTPPREVILPIVLDSASRNRIYLAVPKRTSSLRVRRISAPCSPLNPFQTFMDPRLNASQTFVRIFGGVLSGVNIQNYYFKLASLGAIATTPQSRELFELFRWPRKSERVVTTEKVATCLPIFSFDKGYNLGEVSSFGSSSWRVFAFISFMDHVTRDIIQPSAKSSTDPVQWLELKSLSSLTSMNPSIELMAAILKLSAAI